MRLSPEAVQALAAEYVAGTLRGRARRRFEAMARRDRAVHGAIAQWEAFLTPLAERVETIEPPARVWTGIESRLGSPARSQPTQAGLGLWQSLGMLASGLAAVLAVAFLWLSPARHSDPELVAVLTASDSVPRMVVSVPAAGDLRVRVVHAWKGTEGKSLQLWAVPRNGAPRSIGLVANESETRIRIAASDARLAGASAFAVSLEPRGGSPTGEPTGPVLCSGVIASPRRT